MIDIGDSAPDIVLADRAGATHRLADALTHGPVVLAFFKADCASCTVAFPYLERMHQVYAGTAWSIWGISQHPAKAADWFAKNTGVTFPLLIDEDGFPVSNAYDPEATPTIYLVARDGRVMTRYVGMVKDELNALAQQVSELVGRPPVLIAPMDDGKPAFRPG